MIKKVLIIAVISFLSGVGFAQSPAVDQTKKTSTLESKDQFPPQSVTNDDFTVSQPTFLKKQNNEGKGEELEVGFDITNNTDNPHDLYIFVIATYEETDWQYNSFKTRKVIPRKVQIEYFSPYPDDQKNYEYDINGAKEIKKYPKDYKLGVNPNTGKIYTLKDKIIVRSNHLTLYRKNFKYYNNIAIIVYDDEGKVKFRREYILNGRRH
jgi:hypothetical protein